MKDMHKLYFHVGVSALSSPLRMNEPSSLIAILWHWYPAAFLVSPSKQIATVYGTDSA
jgi:hypothetical protein